MLERVSLTTNEAIAFKDALESELNDQVIVEDTTNLTTLMGFLGTRFLSVPRLQAHGQFEGDGWIDDWMLMKGRDGFVVLQQRAESGDEKFKGPRPVAAFIVLRSKLDCAKEDRQEGWPLRVRALMLDIVAWTLENGKTLMDTHHAFPGRPLWEALLSPAGSPRMLEPDSEKLRSVLSGERTVHDLWPDWALDEKAAEGDFQSALYMMSVSNQILDMARRPGIRPA